MGLSPKRIRYRTATWPQLTLEPLTPAELGDFEAQGLAGTLRLLNVPVHEAGGDNRGDVDLMSFDGLLTSNYEILTSDDDLFIPLFNMT